MPRLIASYAKAFYTKADRFAILPWAPRGIGVHFERLVRG